MNKKIISNAIELRHKLHMYPELSGEEVKTKETLMNYLKDNTSLQVVDRGLWFYAKYEARKPSGKGPIALRGDFDAIKVTEDDSLPYASKNKGVAHKCGHDGHVSALCAFAEMVDEEGAGRDIYFVFQHGEETGIGGKPASSVISENNIEEVYAFHNYPGYPFGTIVTRAGTINCASTGVELIFTGTPTHASTPELGKNPAKAISKLVLELDGMVEECSQNGLALATVVQVDIGEFAFGISAHKGKLCLTARAENQKDFDDLLEMIQKKAREYAAADDLKLEINYYDRFPETYNHAESIEKVKSLCDENGWEYIEMKEPMRSSEDFGYFTQKTKGALIWLGAGVGIPTIHDKDFDYNDDLIEVSCEVFKKLCE